jgi:Ca2+-transporting ATPase
MILVKQFTSTVVMILILGAGISVFLKDYPDAIAIGAILVLNALLGFSQEYRAEKAMAALKITAVPRVRVRRGGVLIELSSRQLVPGDLVLLEAGNLVAADSRVLESANLQIQEAALTGESESVPKDWRALTETDLPLADQSNMAFMGTTVTAGRGLAIVTGTGMDTQIGRVALMVQATPRDQTPLERRLDQVGRMLVIAALSIVGMIFVLGMLRGQPFGVMLITSVTIAVAAVPEGLPAVVTIALALGAQRMLKRNALIRKLLAVETLGGVTVICSDKTGTLTENQMTLVELRVPGRRVSLPQEPIDLATEMNETDQAIRESASLRLLLIAGALCNDAVLDSSADCLRVSGDPTEAAMVFAAARLGLKKNEIERLLPRVAEVPFESERKRMTTVHRSSDAYDSSVLQHLPLALPGFVEFTKGAVDNLLEISTHILIDGRVEVLNREWRDWIIFENGALAGNGMRVLGAAFRPLHSPPTIEDAGAIERNLVFVGMMGMLDPPRREAKSAVARCNSAGIQTVMITGDHPLTAQHVARDLELLRSGGVVTGHELTRASAQQLQQIVGETSVFARVSPEHKLAIIQALQKRGHVVAMTGDGINDAPALKKADIGVAMGVTGTDVAKQAADMVLLDDNFATIVSAVEEGRLIYDNIRKFIRYILATNSGELWLMLLAPATGMPLPLVPLQILWMNLVTDGLPAVALTLEPPERDVMNRPPYQPDETIFGRGLGLHVVWVGLLMGLISLGIGYFAWREAIPEWKTLVFTTITLSQMAHVLAIRSQGDSLFRIGLFSNKWMLAAVSLTILLQVALIYVPVFQRVFDTRPLSARALLLSLLLASVVFWAVELEKWIRRKRVSVHRLSS